MYHGARAPGKACCAVRAAHRDWRRRADL